jgi:hypothetical protein
MRNFIDEQSEKEFYEKAREAVAELRRISINDLTEADLAFGKTVFCRDGGRWFDAPTFYAGFTKRDGKTNWSAYPFGFGTSRRLSTNAEVYIIDRPFAAPQFYAEMINALEEKEGK